MKILCLTGTSPYSFERLVSYIDRVFASKNEVIIQLGNTSFNSQISDCFDYCDRKEILKLIEEADIIITQGGYGSMMDALAKNKKTIAVPREVKFKETLHDQKEHVDYLAKKGFLLPCYDIEKLEVLVTQLYNNQIILKPFKPESDIKVKNLVEDFLNNLEL